MMLPNESLLVVLQFADFRTVVLAKLSAKRFLRLVTEFAEELARQHSFLVTFSTTNVTYSDMTTRAEHSSRYELGNEASFTAACRELAGAIGPHAVANLSFYGNTWNAYDAGLIFEAAPPLKYAEDVTLFSQYGSIVPKEFEGFMSNFVRMKSLHFIA